MTDSEAAFYANQERMAICIVSEPRLERTGLNKAGERGLPYNFEDAVERLFCVATRIMLSESPIESLIRFIAGGCRDNSCHNNLNVGMHSAQGGNQFFNFHASFPTKLALIEYE